MCGSDSSFAPASQNTMHRSFRPGVSWAIGVPVSSLSDISTSRSAAPACGRWFRAFGPSHRGPLPHTLSLPSADPRWAPTSAESGRHGFSRLYFLSTIFPPMPGLGSQIARPPSAWISILRHRVAVLIRLGQYHIIGRDHDTLNYMPPHPASGPVF